MAWRNNYNYRRNNWNRGGRYYGRRRGYYNNNSTNRRATGNMRAAKQQADQSTFTVNIPSQLSAFCAQSQAFLNQNTVAGGKKLGIYAMNIFDQLRKSDFFNNYASMYDEFKIDKIKVKLLPTKWAVNGNTNSYYYKNLTVYTAWDRTGLNDSQYDVTVGTDFDKQTTPASTNTWMIGTLEGTNTATEGVKDFGGLYVTIGDDITTYSSAESRVVNPNTNTSIVRWLSPKTMQERSQWLSTASLKQWYYVYDDNRGRYCNIPVSDIKGYYQDEDFSVTEQIVTITSGGSGTAGVRGLLQNYSSPLSSENPCSLLEDTGIKFKPTLLVGIYPEDSNVTPNGDGLSAPIPNNKITFNVETEVVCSFRGLRKASVVAA